MAHVYDTIIIGGGPAGLTAGIYAGRARLDSLLIEKGEFGGQAATTEDIENYPGVIDENKGPEITNKMRKQAETFGIKFAKDEIVEVDFSERIKIIKGKKETYNAKTIIIASGAYPRLAGFKNESEFRGKGISYCATCDGSFFSDLEVAVIGGGDSALTEALVLTKYASNVTIIHRRDEFRGAKSIQEKVFNNPKIKVIFDTVPEEAKGDVFFEGLSLKNIKTGEKTEYKADGCFVFVGYTPVTEIFKGKINLDEIGYIITDEDMRCNIPGIFAAGDVRKKSLRQVITAASDGAIAATAAERYIEDQF